MDDCPHGKLHHDNNESISMTVSFWFHLTLKYVYDIEMLNIMKKENSNVDADSTLVQQLVNFCAESLNSDTSIFITFMLKNSLHDKAE